MLKSNFIKKLHFDLSIFYETPVFHGAYFGKCCISLEDLKLQK
jgi:hypothetical protein